MTLRLLFRRTLPPPLPPDVPLPARPMAGAWRATPAGDTVWSNQSPPVPPPGPSACTDSESLHDLMGPASESPAATLGSTRGPGSPLLAATVSESLMRMWWRGQWRLWWGVGGGVGTRMKAPEVEWDRAWAMVDI